MGDPAIGLDTLLKFGEVIGVLGGGAVIAFRLGAVTARVEQTLKTQNQILHAQREELAEMKGDMKKLYEALSLLAVQGTRLDRIDRDISDLRRGRGYIVEDRPAAPSR